MERLICLSSDALSSDNGLWAFMEMMTCSSSDAFSSDNGAGGINGVDNVYVY